DYYCQSADSGENIF
nr:immunoglobulin light chain junction region [Macaca mulatta]